MADEDFAARRGGRDDFNDKVLTTCWRELRAAIQQQRRVKLWLKDYC
jgi:hypothetical protein